MNDKGVAQTHVNRSFFLTRGKMLGGSSSLNYHIYSRGVPEDYDEWATVAPGWDWPSVLPYFKKLENMTDLSVFEGKNAPLHSTSGPVKVSRPQPNPFYRQINEILLNSFAEMGIPRLTENNGYETIGVALPHFTFYNGRRSSTAEAYLRPSKDKPNLYVAKYATVNRVLIDSYRNQARGVEVRLKSGRVIKVYADLEVILSAGSINTPKILMLSGIGPKEHLQKFNIDVIADLPVGKNLQDHGIVPVITTGEQGLQTAFQNFLVATELGAYPVPIQCGFFNLNNTPGFTTRPLFQFFNMHVGATASFFGYVGCKGIANFDDKFCISLAEANAVRDIEVTALIYLHPLSRGEVTLRSVNPLDDPNIEMGSFRDQEDLRVLTKAYKYLLGLSNTTYFRKLKAEVAKLQVSACDKLEWGSDDYWECYVRNTLGTLLHPVGTCPMGIDGVVDERLRVHSVLGLRVADASIMPTIPSGNTNAPSIMIGEKAADIIKTDYDYLANKL